MWVIHSKQRALLMMPAYGDLYRGSITFAELLRGDRKDEVDVGRTNQTVALLCPSSPLFLFAWLGLMRLGFSVLLIAWVCPAIRSLMI